jgi:hypothetical protein
MSLSAQPAGKLGKGTARQRRFEEERQWYALDRIVRWRQDKDPGFWADHPARVEVEYTALRRSHSLESISTDGGEIGPGMIGHFVPPPGRGPTLVGACIGPDLIRGRRQVSLFSVCGEEQMIEVVGAVLPRPGLGAGKSSPPGRRIGCEAARSQSRNPCSASPGKVSKARSVATTNAPQPRVWSEVLPG